VTRDGLSRRALLSGAGAVGLAALAGCSAPSRAPRTDTGGVTTPDDGDGSRPDGESPYAEVYRQVVDSVVIVRGYDRDGRQGQGSGFVYRDRYVVTNQHVVDGAETLTVGFGRDDWYDGEVAGEDVYSDLAVVEIADRPASATPLRFVDEEPPVGTEVVAIGAPFGLGQSASAGVISGVDRSLPAPNNFTIPDAVQTDAAVNPGNSGGPLVALDGAVVGVINSGGGDNIGFGISAQLARRVLPALVENGAYHHSFMGVGLQTVTPLLAEANGLSEPSGVYVGTVRDDGPSAGTLRGTSGNETVNGVEVPVGGDVIVALDGVPIRSLADLSTYLALETSPGDRLEVTVIRDGERRTVSFRLGRRPQP